MHLGHTITLKKLRDFQRDGHTVIFLVGDFTAMIGDPTGRSETRKPLSREAIAVNAETYRGQAFKILDPERTEVRFNSEWMDGLGVRRLIELAAHLSVARLLERDDFEKRLAREEPLFLHELLYPLIQGYDSVALEADIEIGGTDQKFNMLVGRELQRAFKQAPQVVMTMPLMEGLDGDRQDVQVAGQLRRYHREASGRDVRASWMRVSDPLMARYYQLLTDITAEELSRPSNPASCIRWKAKKRLASTVVEEYHGALRWRPRRAQNYFESKFQRREVPTNVPVYRIAEDIWICELMKQLNSCTQAQQRGAAASELQARFASMAKRDQAMRTSDSYRESTKFWKSANGGWRGSNPEVEP